MPREERITTTLVELADSLVDDFDVVDLLSVLTDRCVEMLDVSTAGLMLAAPGEGLRVVASSNEAMRLLELFELQSKEGPCLDCYSTGRALVNLELVAVEKRWPRFTSQAVAAGFKSVHALPMRLRGTVIGALNLFRAEDGILEESDVIVGQALADVATIAILQHRAGIEASVVNAQLSLALTSRIVIEQAKGIVAEQANLSIQDAFLRLRRHARNRNLRLSEVCESIVNRSLLAKSLDPLPPR